MFQPCHCITFFSSGWLKVLGVRPRVCFMTSERFVKGPTGVRVKYVPNDTRLILPDRLLQLRNSISLRSSVDFYEQTVN